MSLRPSSKKSRGWFVGAKTPVPIPCRHPLTRDVLIRGSLDPAVEFIEFVAEVAVLGETARLDAVVFCGHDGRWLVEVDELVAVEEIDVLALQLLAADQLGLKRLPMSAAELRKGPVAANCARIWRCRDVRMSAAIASG